MVRKLFVFLCLAVATVGARQAQAAFIPVGVQNGVSYNTVVNTWGWSVLYRGDYGDFLPISNVFTGAGQYLMLAGIEDGSDTIDVLAAALTTDVLSVTALNATHAANGAFWYYNDSSMGFTPISTISQNSADVSDAPGFGGNLALGAQKLSWHTGGIAGVPTNLNGGWRSGNTTFLNSEPSGWDRIVFTINVRPSDVPEPASIAVFGLAAAASGFFGWRRTRRQNG